MKNAYVSIISSNYFPQALSLVESFRRIYPQENFTLLVLDIEPIKDQFLPQTQILTPENLGINPEILKGMRRYYDVVELATSLKPFVLRYLLEEGFDTATYLDPDILIFGNIEDGIELCSNSGISLTPHRYSPSPSPEEYGNDLDFLKYGVFNLGYICLNRDSLIFLKWWSESLIFNCTRYPEDSVFTDQKWIDLVPAYFNYSLIANVGFNVAPWNLDERQLSFQGAKIFVNQEKELAFFHFSQISNLLSGGGLSKTWIDKLERLKIPPETQVVFNSLVDEYVRSLQLHSKEKRWVPYVRVLVEPYCTLDHHKRRILRNSYRKFGNEGKTQKYALTSKFHLLKQLGFLLSRLDSYNGLRSGMRSDLRRIGNKHPRISNLFREVRDKKTAKHHL